MKDSTALIQNFLVVLGNKLGFDAEKESCIDRINRDYSPVHDVVWWIDMSKIFEIDKMALLFNKAPDWLGRIKRIPLAVFEIEGSTSSSKNQVGNAANLFASTGIYKFIIVNNGEASTENDTYRRGIKIAKYFKTNWGDRNLILCDWTHIKQTDSFSQVNILALPSRVVARPQKRVGFGGETISIPSFDYIYKCLSESGLICKQNHVPDQISREADVFKIFKDRFAAQDFETAVYLGQSFRRLPESIQLDNCKSASDCRYMPRIDIVAGFHVPELFHEWLKMLALVMREDAAYYPCLFFHKVNNEKYFVNLISVEIETSKNKHSHGGFLNMANCSYCGIWAAPEQAAGHLAFFKKRFGLENIIHFPIDKWL